MKVMQFTLPWPISTNSMRGVTKKGHHFTPKKLQDFYDKVAFIVAEMEQKPFENPVEVRWIVNPPNKQKRDLDNLIKTAQDAIKKAGLLKDDSTAFVKGHTITMGEEVKGGSVEIIISEIEQKAAV